MVESERDSMDLKKFISEATSITGTPGYEAPVAEYIARAFRPLCDEVTIDQMYSVVSRKGQGGPKFMICAHEDEIGMVVTKIEDDGCIRLTRTGGVDPRILPAMEVHVLTEEGPLYGVIGAKPPHLVPIADRKKSVLMEQVYVDVGLDAEEVRARVRIGDQVVILGKAVELANDCLSAKTMDDRAGVATMLECANVLNTMNTPAEVYLVATCKEEVGCWGAAEAAYNLAPDVAIVVDVCHGEGPGTGRFEAFPLTKPVIAVGPNLHPVLTKKLKEIAAKHHIGYEIQACRGTTGTDAAATDITREGIPTVLISIPLKYMHTAVEVLSMEAVREVGRLMAHFINELSREWEDIKWY